MRLTLRTLLAYMDDILESSDAEQIAKRVQESDFASGLLHRIRDVTRRLRITAADAADPGGSLDPNTVAEYLDNTLPADRVPDFEKVCLESDAHLSELGSCHQILTLVLGEPAEVDPDSRLRMYGIANAANATVVTPSQQGHSESKEAASGNGELLEVASSVSARQEVPAYLRERRGRRFWPVALVALAGAVAIAGLFAAGQFRAGTPMGDWLAFRSVPDVVNVDPGPSIVSVELPKEPVAPTSDTESSAIDGGVSPVIKQPTEHPVVMPIRPEPADERPEAPLPKIGPTITPVEPVDAGPTEPARPSSPAPDEPMAPTSPATETVNEPKKPAAEVPPEVGKPARPEGVPVGTHLSATEVLVRFDGQSQWQRVPAQAVLNEGDEIASLPTYRPTISLQGDVGLQLFDGNRIELLPLDANGTPGLDVRYGQMILKPGKTKDTRLRLRFGERSGVVGFADLDSILMAEVGRPDTSNVDPETHPAPLIAKFYATSGEVLWQEGGQGELIRLPAPMMLKLDGNPTQPVAAKEIPSWSSPDAVSLLDQRASATIDRSLSQDREVNLALHELAAHRQREVRWLAMRSLGHLGDFGLLVEAFNDPEQKLVWQDHFDELRKSLARGPESAARVREAMEFLYAGDGETLYELLWKYRKPELSKTEAGQLLNLMDHQVLAVRVLSFWNLREVTGLSLYYRPEHPSAKRATSLQKWRERMDTPATIGSDGTPTPPEMGGEP